jgi:hypothetical protein
MPSKSLIGIATQSSISSEFDHPLQALFQSGAICGGIEEDEVLVTGDDCFVVVKACGHGDVSDRH